jgi:hypothetical protein
VTSDVRIAVIELLADYLERPAAELHDGFDVVNDFDWSRHDDDDVGLLFELFMDRFEVRDTRFEFGEHYRGPSLLRPVAWLHWRLLKYPTVVFSRMTVGNLVSMAERKTWDRSLEDPAR